MGEKVQSSAVPTEVKQRTLALWENNRLQCGWFVRQDFVPRTRADFARCLNLMARHGDRATYVLSRRLMKCL